MRAQKGVTLTVQAFWLSRSRLTDHDRVHDQTVVPSSASAELKLG